MKVATEDVVYMLEGMGLDTGVDLRSLVSCGTFISEALGRETASRAGRALDTKWRQEREELLVATGTGN